MNLDKFADHVVSDDHLYSVGDHIPQATAPVRDMDPAYRLHCERHYAATGEWKPEWGDKPRRAA